MSQVEIFTDGSCYPNPNGRGGIGIVMISGQRRLEISQGYLNTTNNRMELMAVIVGLEHLKKPRNVVIYSDSEYVVRAVANGWVQNWLYNGWKTREKNPVKNKDLWLRLLKAKKDHEVTFIWIKGHASDVENNRADALANQGRLGNELLCDLES